MTEVTEVSVGPTRAVAVWLAISEYAAAVQRECGSAICSGLCLTRPKCGPGVPWSRRFVMPRGVKRSLDEGVLVALCRCDCCCCCGGVGVVMLMSFGLCVTLLVLVVRGSV
jgi:hypothetical protein